MYPQLMGAASRLAPHLSRLMSRGASSAFSPFGRLSWVDVPDIDADKVQPLDKPSAAPKDPNQPSVPISTDNISTPTNFSSLTQLVPALGGLGLFPASEATPMNWLEMAKYRSPLQDAPAATPPTPSSASAGLPLPRERPAGAPPPQPDTSWFMRNALMMQDPNGGGLIDPVGAASVRGPDLISKMMKYLHNRQA